MLWKQVNNKGRAQPKTGSWPSWKAQIAHDCDRQCVYCAIPDSRYGGLDNFHVDHFRPKKKFPGLQKRITNLYLACAICNRFKSDDWPADPAADYGVAAYPDPGGCDYTSLINIDPANGVLAGKFAASTYVIERLYLNRPQLIRLRRAAALEQRLTNLENALEIACKQLCNTVDDTEAAKALLAEICSATIRVNQAYRNRERAQPYTLEDIRRPSAVKRRKPAKKTL
jgi:hypothetical protein